MSQKKATSPENEDGHELLIRAGFLRQAHSGIFHLLPLGLRVLEKAEHLIEKHMQSVSASKVDLSSLSSRELWEKSGRLDGRNKELFQLEDRKEAKYLLAPTHEEEITTIVKNAVHSYRDLPLRLYQISRKYRDEARPRQGLLRGREFIMKDLYTFDLTPEQAMETYRAVSKAYRGIFDDLNLPYLVANADSGNMGGNHSHEYHFASEQGEDTIIKCHNCDLCMNEELLFAECSPEEKPPQEAEGGTVESTLSTPQLGTCAVPHETLFFRLLQPPQPLKHPTTKQERQSFVPQHNLSYDEYLQKQAGTPAVEGILQVYIPKGDHEINLHALEKLHPNIDTAGDALSQKQAEGILSQSADRARHIIHDPRIAKSTIQSGNLASTSLFESPFKLTKVQENDRCPSCGNPSLQLHRAIEIGHTFHLGTRYSKPLEAQVQDPSNAFVDIEMGCHGIGVSRLVGAMASMLADAKGLNWPLAIAPFGLVIVGTGHSTVDETNQFYDSLTEQLGQSSAPRGLDAVIDDRERPVGWKLNDADLIGYPFIVVLGKAWKERRAVELQCRRLKLKETLSMEGLVQRVQELSTRL